jgi:hypothetical protein
MLIKTKNRMKNPLQQRFNKRKEVSNKIFLQALKKGDPNLIP